MPPRKARTQKPTDLFGYFRVQQDPWPTDPRIDKIVSDMMPRTSDRVPGFAVAVRMNQHVVHLNCYGYANLETGAKITPDTIFDLGSLSKQFTALAVLELLFNKQIALNDHLSKFFKDFPRYADSITVEDLIHHTSGLPSYTDIYVASRQAEADWYDRALATSDHWYPQMKPKKKKELTNRDILDWVVSQKLLPRPPDTEYEYCNTGYVLLAELVTAVSGKRFADFISHFLLRAMGMKDSFVFDERSRFSRSAGEVLNHARCYNREGKAFIPVGYTPLNFITGDGNIHSTITDLLRWELSLFANDLMGLCFPDKAKEFGGGNSIRDVLWSPVQIRHCKQVNYGAGWNLLRERYEKELTVNGKRITRKYESRAEFHRGEWLGWRSYFARASRWPVPRTGRNVDPDKMESLGIVVLSNADFGGRHFSTCRITQQIAEIYWGKAKKENIMSNFNCD